MVPREAKVNTARGCGETPAWLCLSGCGSPVLPTGEALTPGTSKADGKLAEQQEWHMEPRRLDLYFVSSPVEREQQRAS